MYCLTNGVHHLQEAGMCHGDIQPRTVHMTSDGEVVLLNNMLVSGRKRNYEKIILKDPKDYIGTLSPTLLKAVPSALLKTNDDLIASDVWSIGMTTMVVACNLDFRIFHDMENHRIRYDLIKQNYDIMRRIGYSENLVSVINQCLEETEPRRAKLHEIKEILDQVQKEPFEGPDRVPGDSVLHKSLRGSNSVQASMQSYRDSNFMNVQNLKNDDISPSQIHHLNHQKTPLIPNQTNYGS